MITLLTGENDFEIMRSLRDIKESFEGTSEQYEGADIDVKQLPDIFAGATLFADKRLVIIDTLSANKTVWNVLPEWLERLSDDVHLVLVEQKPDKRTKTYKELQKVASIQICSSWTDKDSAVAERWVIKEAAGQSVMLDQHTARLLVSRVGVDQWQLFHALEKLALFDAVTIDLIDQVVDENISENIFNLFDATLNGDTTKVVEMIRTLRQTEDPYMVLGLLSSQMIQLAALATADGVSPTDVAKAIGAHPFAVSKLSSHARDISRSQLTRYIRQFADADTRIKSSPINPWIIIEQALFDVR